MSFWVVKAEDREEAAVLYQGKAVTPRFGGGNLWGKKLGSKRGQTLVPLLLVLSLAALVGLAYFFRQEIPIPNLGLEKQRRIEDQVRCSFVTNMGTRNLRISFSIPSEDRHQRDTLKRVLPGIKHDLLMVSGSGDLMTALENRDFAYIKDRITAVVNARSPTPVKKIYLERFFYD